jgi:hypothetical protein
MIAQKNVTHLFYATSAAVSTALPTTAYGIGFRNVGESLCHTDALVAGDKFQVIGMNALGKIIESPVYEFSNLISSNYTSLSALQSQVSTIGYNGTDGDIVETASGNYLVTIGFKDLLKQVGGKRLFKFSEYQAGTTCAKRDVAINLVDQLVKNMSRDAFARLVPSAICSFAQVNGDCFDDDVYIVKGSKYVTFKTDSDYSTNEVPAVGDYVRIGAPGVTPTVASPVYKIVEASVAGHSTSDYIVLDRPVTNATGTYVEGTFDVTVIRAADAALTATKWGITLTGNDTDAPFEPGLYGINLIMFTVGVSPDFGSTEVRLKTVPFVGEATYRQLAQLDWELQANGREKYRIAEYPVKSSANILSTDTIDHLRTFVFKDTASNGLGNGADSYMTLMIASDSSANATLDTILAQTTA